MTNNLSLLSISCILFVVLPIIVLVVNNRVISARTWRSQKLLGATLLLSLIAFAMHSVFILVISVTCFAAYCIKLGSYFRVSLHCMKHNEKVPSYKRP